MINVTRRLYKSKIKKEWDIHYYVVMVYHHGIKYQKNINPIYDIDEFLEELEQELRKNDPNILSVFYK